MYACLLACLLTLQNKSFKETLLYYHPLAIGQSLITHLLYLIHMFATGIFLIAHLKLIHLLTVRQMLNYTPVLNPLPNWQVRPGRRPPSRMSTMGWAITSCRYGVPDAPTEGWRGPCLCTTPHTATAVATAAYCATTATSGSTTASTAATDPAYYSARRVYHTAKGL